MKRLVGPLLIKQNECTLYISNITLHNKKETDKISLVDRFLHEMTKLGNFFNKQIIF